jgi:hypothetical protein
MQQSAINYIQTESGHWFGIRVERPFSNSASEAYNTAKWYMDNIGGTVDIIAFRSVNDAGRVRANNWPTNFCFYLRWPFKIALLDRICLTDEGHDGRVGEVKGLVDLLKAKNVPWNYISRTIVDTSKLTIEAALDEIHRYPVVPGAANTPIPLILND